MSTHSDVTSLIEDFYQKGGQIPDEFETVTKKTKKKKNFERQDRSDRRGDYEHRDRSDPRDRRAEPRPRQTEDRRNRPAPRPAQTQQAPKPAANTAAPRGGVWGTAAPLDTSSNVASSSQQSWAKEPTPMPQQQPAVPEPISVPAKNVKSWAQITKVQSPPKPAPAPSPAVSELPLRANMNAHRAKRASPPPSPQLESDPAVIVDKIHSLSVEDQPSSSASEHPSASEPAEVPAEPPKPVSIGDPAKSSYAGNAPTQQSVWGAAALSTTAAPFEPPAQQAPPAPSIGQPYQQPPQQRSPITSPNQYEAGPSSGGFAAQPQESSQFGSPNGLTHGSTHGSGFLSSLSGDDSSNKELGGMVPMVNFGEWNLADDTEVQLAKPRSPKTEPKEGGEFAAGSSNQSNSMSEQPSGAGFMAGFQNPYGFTGDAVQPPYGGEPLPTQYTDYNTPAAPHPPEAEPEAPSGSGRYNKGNRGDKGGANGSKHAPQQHHQVPMQQQQFYHNPQQMQYAGMPYPVNYPQPYYGFPYSQQGQFPQGQSQQFMKNQRQAYSVPPQFYPGQQAGYQYPGQQQQGSDQPQQFDYPYAPPAPGFPGADSAATGQPGDKNSQQGQAGQQQEIGQPMYHQQQQQFGYPTGAPYQYYQQQHMQQPQQYAMAQQYWQPQQNNGTSH